MLVFNISNLRLKILTLTLAIVSLIYAKLSFADSVSLDNDSKISDAQVFEIYRQIVAASGQTQDALPLRIENNPEVNAYNDGHQVGIYRGLIASAKNKDEIALILGHEVAHGMLQHLGKLNTPDAYETSVMEGNADKYGAFLAMKAGYDVCVGREVFYRWMCENGNALGLSHPANGYRFLELNVNCGKL